MLGSIKDVVKARFNMDNMAGLIFMGLVWSAIIGLNVFCFSKIFKEKEEKIVGLLEIEAEIDEEEHHKHTEIEEK